MKGFTLFGVLLLHQGVAIGVDQPERSSQDWPWWRGPDRNGIAEPYQDPPLTWSDTRNIFWKTKLCGRGHGSPIVVRNHVLITAATHEPQHQMLLSFCRETGEELWRQIVHAGRFPEGGNRKSTMASSTPASDGSRIFINFLNNGAVYTSALDRKGNLLWQTKITDYVVHQGYGSSPALYQNLVIVSADNKGGGAIAALDSSNGDVVWKRERPEKPNYPSPIILNVAGRDQLLMTGCDLVTSLDPLTGEELWEINGATTECVTSAVTDGMHIFTSGGYPDNHISAVHGNGSGKIVWRNNLRMYVPSMLVKNGYLFAVLDAGVATCHVAATGKEVWKARLEGNFSSSPVLVGNRIYVTNETGATFVFRATPDKFDLLARNHLGDNTFATPAICGSRIYTRVTDNLTDRHQEVLYCIGRSSP